jgi:hypothetical protein
MRQRANRSVTLAALSLIVAGVLASAGSSRAADWKAGTARVVITPQQSMWMSGYGSRDHPSEGTSHDLWAKALVLDDGSGRKAALVTLDVCGIDRGTSLAIRDALKSRIGLDRDRVVLSCSHTHSGPVVGTNLMAMYYRLDDEQKRRVDAYTKFLIDAVMTVVVQAAQHPEPAVLSWESGRADFAVNRRENKEADVPTLRSKIALKGPVDHDVPVLKVAGPDGRPRAIVFGYACHSTVLSFYKFSGDYAGHTQIALEAKYPGAQAMFVAGCGADQNPVPRRKVELAESYGTQLAASVERVLERPMRPLSGPIRSAYEEVDLKLDTLPSRSQIEEDAKSSDLFVATRARMLLKILDSQGHLDPAYPYPAQAWQIGELTWIFLGGEVVVDFSLRLKRNLGSSHTWVSAYCNDVMAYIPSLRVLREGGYEGGGAMIYYGLPTKWSEEVEEQIVDAVGRVVKATASRP